MFSFEGQAAGRVYALAGAVPRHEARLHRAQLPHPLLQLPRGGQEGGVLRRGPQGDLWVHQGEHYGQLLDILDYTQYGFYVTGYESDV